MNVDDEMEVREQGEIADFYATMTTLFSPYLKTHRFFDDVMSLELMDEVNLETFMKRFKEEYMDHLGFDRMVIVEFLKGNEKAIFQIN